MKRVGLFTGVACTALFASAEMEPATPESQGVSSEGILEFIDAAEKTFDAGPAGALHGFVIVRHGKTIAEGSWKPFNTLNETHMLYSHSKSFTSTAIGFLVDDGKLDLDERVADIFPEDLPEEPAEGIRDIRVRDLLTMNVGSYLNHDVANGPDWRKRFFARKLDLKPGTGFKYDSDATYVLAGIVERRTGKKLMDFLEERLFSKIGIEQAWSTVSPQGIACGGWGMNMTTRELARFGQLYLQKGWWNGENIISPLWVTLATARHTWSGWQYVGAQKLGAGGDWEQGYGFQFWRCTHGAYRADGAAGQLTVVMPEQDMVVSVHAGLDDMQKELDLIWTHLLPAVKDTPLPENAAAQAKLKDRLAGLAIKLPGLHVEYGPRKYDDHGLERHAFEFKDNHRGFKSFSYQKGDNDVYACILETRCGRQEIVAGTPRSHLGLWQTSSIAVDPENCEGLGAYIGRHKLASTCWYDADGAFHFKAYFTGDTGFLELTDRNGKLTGEFKAMNGCKLESK